MALPTKIPSTFRRTPIVKRQDPALYSTSATQLDSEAAFNAASSFGMLSSYALRYRSAISVTARLLGLRADVEISVIEEEISRLDAKADKTAREYQVAGTAIVKGKEAASYRRLIIKSVSELARRDAVDTKLKVSQLSLGNSFKTELNQIIDEISSSTSGVNR